MWLFIICIFLNASAPFQCPSPHTATPTTIDWPVVLPPSMFNPIITPYTQPNPPAKLIPNPPLQVQHRPTYKDTNTTTAPPPLSVQKKQRAPKFKVPIQSLPACARTGLPPLPNTRRCCIQGYLEAWSPEPGGLQECCSLSRPAGLCWEGRVHFSAAEITLLYLLHPSCCLS